MIRLHYADGFLTTSESVADAVMQYARALAERSMSDVITVPIVDERLERASSKLLIGPASQLYTSPVPVETIVFEDDRTVADLLARTQRVRADPIGLPVDPAEAPLDVVDDWEQLPPPST